MYHLEGQGSPPIWALVLEAAGYDPLRAQLIMDEDDGPLKQIWWERYLVDRRYRAQAYNKDQ